MLFAPRVPADTYGSPIAQVEYLPPPVPIGPVQSSGPAVLALTGKAGPVATESGNERPVPRAVHVFAGGSEPLEGTAPVDAPPAVSAFPTNLWAPDATIAVGHHYIIAANTWSMTYYDKQGNQLPVTNTLPTSLSMNTFFAGFLNGKNPDGTKNTQNINTVINLPATPHFPKCTWTQDQVPQPAAGPEKACVQQVYDARVQWDPSRNRFWVQAAARPLIWSGSGAAQPDDPRLARRFEMIAVSKTEDPRMGWYQYVLVDDYADWPRMTINGRVLVLGHQGDKNVWFLDADKLAAGNPTHGSVELNKFVGAAFPEADVLAYVTHHGNTDGMTYLLGIGNGGKTWTIYGFDGNDPNHLKKQTFSTKDWAPIWVRNNPIFRNGFLYVTGSMAVAPNRESIRVMRVPLRVQNDRSIVASVLPADGFLDLFFGRNGPGDAPTDLVSYHVPSMEVTSNGDMVIAYTRVGVQTAKPLYPEVRYSVVRAKGQIERSRLVKAATSDVQPDKIDDGGNVDLTAAAIDPVDDRTVWSINPYGDNNGFHFLISQLRP
jgi:hypothetical protein